MYSLILFSVVFFGFQKFFKLSLEIGDKNIFLNHETLDSGYVQCTIIRCTVTVVYNVQLHGVQ